MASNMTVVLLNACMAVAITVLDVPDEVRDELAARAARAGKSLQEYLRGMLVDVVAHPPVDDVLVRATNLAAPGLVTFETANIIRRSELAGLVSSDQSAQAHADLLALNIELWPYELLAARAWELRRNLPIYDGAYVALAELIGSRLVTLDRRIGGAPGLRCGVVMP